MPNIKKVLDSSSIVIIYLLAFLLPLSFTTLTTEFFETAKFFLLVIATLLLLVIWAIRFMTDGKLELPKTPLDIFLVLFLGVAILSTIMSATRFPAIFGSIPKVHSSLIYICAVTLLYFLIVFNIKTIKQVTFVVNLMIGSGVLLSIASLLTFFKVSTPVALVGSLTNAALYLSLLIPLSLRLLIAKPSIGVLVNLIIFSALVLVGNNTAWIVASFGVIATLVVFKKSLTKILPFLVLITGVTLFLAVFSISPALQDKTPLGKFAASAPKEVQLPFGISWKISAGAFRDAPLIGTGPATYLYNLTQYKPLEYNQTNLWNTRLTSAHNFLLQTLAETGGLGLALILAAIITFILFWLKNGGLAAKDLGLATAGVSFILLMALSPLSILIQTAGFMIWALAMASREKQIDYEINPRSVGAGAHPLIPTLILLPILVLIVAGFYFTSKMALGEYYHHQALNAVSKNQGLEVYNNLVAAEKQNPYADLYRSDLAQTNFALANALATQKGPTEASPTGSLTDQDKANIQQLLQQSIAEGRSAVAIAPRSAANWEVLASIYKQISGVSQNALQFSLDAYGRAIALDPLNPLLRLSVGGVYYQLKNYDLAVRFFDDAVSLKPDYSNALYNLAIALRDKGSYKEGIAIAERLVAQLSGKTDSEDYRLASELLSDLKTKAPATTEPITAEPVSALEKENLPKVLNLPKPESIATPEAIKK